MTEVLHFSSRLSQPIKERRSLLITAWAVVLLLTVPQIVLGGLLNQDIAWLTPARLVALAVLLTSTFVWPLIRPLRRLLLAFLVIYGVEGWFFGAVVQHSSFFESLFGGDANQMFFGERLMRIGASVVMLGVLWGMGLKCQDFFLTVGNLKAAAEPERWGMPRKSAAWPTIGIPYALVIVALFLLFMVPAMQPALSKLSPGLVLFAVLCALMNAFAEEFLYRSALLPQVLPLFSKGQSLILVAAWFGIGHYFGVPSGIIGVIFTTIGGWIFAKSMVETRGMGWALFLHWISDFTVYMVILLAGGF